MFNWGKVIIMRCEYQSKRKKNSMLPNPVLRSVQVVKTQIELEELAQDVDMLFMYALMITERLLGSNHNHTIVRLMERGQC